MNRLCFGLCCGWLAICLVAPAMGKDRDRFDFADSPPLPQRNPEADQARSDADQAYQKGEYRRVIELADRLLAAFPTDNPHVAYYHRASAKIELGRQARSAKEIRDGIADARQAISMAENRYRWLYIPYLFGLTSLAEIEGRPEHADLAIQAVGPLLEQPTGEGFTSHDKANLYYQRALAHSSRRNLKAAAADWSQAVQLNPHHLGAHIQRADAYVRLGQTADADVAYGDAVRRFPATPLVINARGTFRRGTGDLAGAVADFSRAVQIDPQFAVGYVNRGLCLAEQNNAQAAEADYALALRQKLDAGTQALALRLRAQARLSLGNAAGSIADYTSALRLNPQDAGLYEERGFAQYFQRDYAAALADFSKVLQLDPNFVRIIPWQALALSRLGKTADVKAQFARVAELRPAPNAWVARLCEFLDERIKPQELIDAAGEFGESGKQARLCEAHYFMGQKKRLVDEEGPAVEQFRQAVATQAFTLAAYRGSRFELGAFSK
ncbi:MAG: tetratricopeptide repeat protein [Planctomycetaceae bacterium]